MEWSLVATRRGHFDIVRQILCVGTHGRALFVAKISARFRPSFRALFPTLLRLLVPALVRTRPTLLVRSEISPPFRALFTTLLAARFRTLLIPSRTAVRAAIISPAIIAKRTLLSLLTLLSLVRPAFLILVSGRRRRLRFKAWFSPFAANFAILTAFTAFFSQSALAQLTFAQLDIVRLHDFPFGRGRRNGRFRRLGRGGVRSGFLRY
jgi:hypothetical protein